MKRLIPDLFNQALTLHQSGNLIAALELYQDILSLEPNHFSAIHSLGIIALQIEHFELAESMLSRALALQPDHAELHIAYGNALNGQQKYQCAINSYQRAITLKANFAEAYFNLGNTYQAILEYALAISAYQKAIALKANYGDAYINCANAQLKIHHYQQALSNYQLALKLYPNYPQLYYNIANALQCLDQHPAAIDYYQQAVNLQPDLVAAYINQAQSLLKLKLFQAALDCSQQALTYAPKHKLALNQIGLALLGLRQTQAALQQFQMIIQLQADDAEAYHNLALVLQELNDVKQAQSYYQQAIAVKSDSVASLFNLALLHFEQKQYLQALNHFARTEQLAADYPLLAAYYLHCKMHICDWQDYQQRLVKLTNHIEQHKLLSAPFPVLTLIDNPEIQQQAATLWTAHYHARPALLGKIPRYQHDKIHIAYCSADFHDHATAHLLIGVLERHNREKFTITAVSFVLAPQDAMQQRVSQTVDRFIDVAQLSDEAIVKQLRALEIDIAIDLKGHTHNSRPDIFALRVAPIQINYLGYPGTMGADYIDYILADKWVLPPEQQIYYSEKVLYLENSYQANDNTRQIAIETPSRTEHGLPESGLIFCCFNHNYKITPEVFDVWVNCLLKVPDSVLWLLASNQHAVANLRSSAENRGVSAQRLIFAETLPTAEHLARLALADLFLDTFPCNAHTTASDALWAGVPVLSCSGNSFMSRVAGSLLLALDLPELITVDLLAYEALILKLAGDRTLLTDIRKKLALNKQRCSLFDTERFCRGLESVLENVLNKVCD